MTSNKIPLIILVLLAIAFAVGVGAPLLTNPKDGDKAMSEDEAIKEAKSLTDKWVGSLKRSLDFLSPSLDATRLTPPSPCRKGPKTFQLTEDKPCFVRISKKAAGAWAWLDYEKMVLSPGSAGMSLQVCRCEKSNTAARGPGLRVSPGKVLKLSDRLKFPVHVGTGVLVQGGPELEVSYFPMGETVTSGCGSGETLVCEAVDAVSLVVLDDGGTVRFKCDGCSAAKPAVVSLK